jgi:hypothetical protein
MARREPASAPRCTSSSSIAGALCCARGHVCCLRARCVRTQRCPVPALSPEVARRWAAGVKVVLGVAVTACARRTLDKTMVYFRSKRPDLAPKPGFMRQLLALDQSLQRLTLASVKGPDDPLLRRCSTWDTSVLRTCLVPAGETPLPRPQPSSAPRAFSYTLLHACMRLCMCRGATQPPRTCLTKSSSRTRS